MPRPITVLVTGATGRQGGAVARLLLSRGHTVRALTRRPGSSAAGILRELGAEIAAGDLADAASMRAAADGADALFLVATPFEAGPAGEARQGRAAAGAAVAAGVKHVVYSSVASADRATGVPHFESKREIEEHLVRLGAPWTVVAPVFFMENLLSPGAVDGLARGTLAWPLPPPRTLQLVAVDDLASVARLALERPGEYQGKRIEVASDALNGPEVAAILSRVTGSGIDYVQAPLAAVKARSEDLGRMWEWLDQVGYACDLEALRRAHPEVGWHNLPRWAREQDWSVIDVATAEQPTA
jgi:uncharacterized protein YbjT (DUF2867 family)